MSPKIAFPTVLLLTLLTLCPCLGQSSPFGKEFSEIRPPAHETIDADTLPPPTPTAGPSSWINYPRSSCCTQVFGGDGPLQAELYFRTGWSIPVDGGIFDRTLSTGWAIQGGGRTLFFNPQRSAAWTVDLGISNIWNHGKHPEIKVPLSVLVPQDPANPVTGPDPQTGLLPPQRANFGTDPNLPGVTIRNLNRTFVNLGFGREWYLNGSAAEQSGWLWRAGLDAGGRWGVAGLELHELRKREDVIGGVWVSLHSDVEIPVRSAIFQFGFRMEWSYTFSDILQQQSDIVDVNLVFGAGVRY